MDNKKLILKISFLAVFVFLFCFGVSNAKNLSVEELKTKIVEIRQKIGQLQEQLQQLVQQESKQQVTEESEAEKLAYEIRDLIDEKVDSCDRANENGKKLSAMSLNQEEKSKVADILMFTGTQQKIWMDFQIPVINCSGGLYSEDGFQNIYKVFSAIPESFWHPVCIFIKSDNRNRYEWLASVTAAHIIELIPSPTTISVIAHEIGHLIHFATINARLVTEFNVWWGYSNYDNPDDFALEDYIDWRSFNYLEDFARTNSVWVQDSFALVKRAIDIALNKKDSILLRKALIFADIYSFGTDQTIFYRTTSDFYSIGKTPTIEKYNVPISRDAQNRIISINGVDVSFIWNSNSLIFLPKLFDGSTKVEQQYDQNNQPLMSSKLSSELLSLGNDSSAQVWFEWGTSVSYGSITLHQPMNSTGNFSALITNLSPNTNYHFRPVARNTAGIFYGADRSFKTPNTACVDSDKSTFDYLDIGKNFYLKGIVDFGGEKYTDYCKGDMILEEYFCSDATISVPELTEKYCSFGCKGGACQLFSSPKNGDGWEIGKRYDILWDSQGFKQAELGLNLYKEPSLGYSNPFLVKKVNEKILTSLGKYSWLVTSGGVIPGDGYFFSLDDGLYKSKGRSDVFSIIAAGTENPFVDIKADGSDGPITIPYNSESILSWKSSGVNTCNIYRSDSSFWGGFVATTSDSIKTGNLANSSIITIVCQNLSNGKSFSDSVTINVSTTIPTCSYGYSNGECKPGASIVFPQQEEVLVVGNVKTISWKAEGDFDKYQIIIGNFVTGNERQLFQIFDQVSEVDYIPANQTSLQWTIPDLLTYFTIGTDYSFDQIKSSFYLQIKLIKNDNEGGVYVASSDKKQFTITKKCGNSDLICSANQSCIQYTNSDNSTASYWACCDNATDCVASNGQCYLSNTVPFLRYVCSKNKWYKCASSGIKIGDKVENYCCNDWGWGDCQTIPSVPTNLRAENITSNSITWKWDTSNGATNYVILFDGEDETETTNIEYIKTGLAPNANYMAQIKACNNAGCSVYSNAVSTKTLALACGNAGLTCSQNQHCIQYTNSDNSTASYWACCDNSTDCVASNGQCYLSNTVPFLRYVCSKNKWYKCTNVGDKIENYCCNDWGWGDCNDSLNKVENNLADISRAAADLIQQIQEWLKKR